jgi:chromosome segregation ATPase
MKTAIKAMLAAVGLAPAGQVEHLAARAREAADRATALEERMTKLRADIENWKRRYEESANTAAEWKHAASAAETKGQRAAAQAEELKARLEMQGAKILALRDQLEKANHAATTAREHLMATEVKLDVIEAAIQVLDVRTRDAVVTRT